MKKLENKIKIDRFVGINLTEEMYNELYKEANEVGLSISAYVRFIIAKRNK